MRRIVLLVFSSVLLISCTLTNQLKQETSNIISNFRQTSVYDVHSADGQQCTAEANLRAKSIPSTDIRSTDNHEQILKQKEFFNECMKNKIASKTDIKTTANEPAVTLPAVVTKPAVVPKIDQKVAPTSELPQPQAESSSSNIKEITSTKDEINAAETLPTASSAEEKISQPTETARLVSNNYKPSSVDSALAGNAKTISSDSIDENANVAATINKWAKAWSDKNLDEYFSIYINNFKPARGLSHKAWEEQRRKRISKPTTISIKISKLKIKTHHESAEATFKQLYVANGKSIVTDKKLLMQRVNKNWYILKEIENSNKSHINHSAKV